MPPDANVTAVSNEEIRQWARVHERAAQLLNDLARYRETGNAFGVGYCLEQIEALGALQAAARGPNGAMA